MENNSSSESTSKVEPVVSDDSVTEAQQLSNNGIEHYQSIVEDSEKPAGRLSGDEPPTAHTESDASVKPQSPKPDHSQPDHSQTGHSQPDNSQPDHSQPDHSQPDNPHSENPASDETPVPLSDNPHPSTSESAYSVEPSPSTNQVHEEQIHEQNVQHADNDDDNKYKEKEEEKQNEEEEDEDDDYDPESLSYSLGPKQSNDITSSSATSITPSSPSASNSSTLLQSVLDRYGKSDKVNLQDLLSNISNVAKTSPQSQPPTTSTTTITTTTTPTNNNNTTNTSSTDPSVLSSSSSSFHYNRQQDHNSEHNKSEKASSSPSSVDYELDIPFTPDDTRAYERFLNEEEEYVASGHWERFPFGSRMFVGNLPSNRVTKAQLFKLFSKYGRVAQIVMKQAYGFIQFHEPDSVNKVIEVYGNKTLRGNSLQLEISKPQVPRNKDNSHNNGSMMRSHRNRSRSPPPLHHHHGARGGGGGGGERDRYRDRDRDFGGSHSSFRGSNRYDMLSSAPSQFGGSSNGGGRGVIPHGGITSNFNPNNSNRVPECQIFLLDRLDNSYIYYVENTFREAGIYVEIEDLPPRVSVNNAIQQLAYEGVLAVVTLDYNLQGSGNVNIQVFDRSEGGGSVRFDEYLKITPQVAVQLVQRVKSQQRGGGYSNRGASGYSSRMDHPSSMGSNAPTMGRGSSNSNNNPIDPGSNLLGALQNMDPASLQQVISVIQSRGGQVNTAPTGSAVNPSGIQQYPYVPGVPATNDQRSSNSSSPMINQLGNMTQLPSYGTQPHQYQSPPQPGAHQLGSNQGSSGNQSTQQVQNIMDQLAKLQGVNH